MITEFHFLRVYWLLCLIPLAVLASGLWQQKKQGAAWQAVCDPHLLSHLLVTKTAQQQKVIYISAIASLFFIIIALAGPSWVKLPIPTFSPSSPHVILLNLSYDMLEDDISPSRLKRARFKLHDLLDKPNTGQWGMIAYSGEPFIVSPLTEDSKTIDALVPSLRPEIMPVPGDNLSAALEMGADLIKQAGFEYGQMLVITASAPSNEAIETARNLNDEAIQSAILPMLPENQQSMSFKQFASAGGGQLLQLSADDSDIQNWLSHSKQSFSYKANQLNHIPLWRDEGRWFLIPALLFLLPLFRRGALKGYAV